ncbi:hypothetical protein B0H11DRAFT_2276436 [Mycena galericulata]|nr:hypothetical protein B0H11DRAFT_2276436 [Mycena galericulata]
MRDATPASGTFVSRTRPTRAARDEQLPLNRMYIVATHRPERNPPLHVWNIGFQSCLWWKN